MRSSHIRAAIAATSVLLSPCASAQQDTSLESSYAALCATAATQQGETCLALARAIAEKGRTASLIAQPARPVLDRAVWGVYADLVGRTMALGSTDGPVFAKVDYSFKDGKIRENWTWYGADARGSKETTIIEAVAGGGLQATNGAGVKFPARAAVDGTVVFAKRTLVGRSQFGYYPTPNGLERRTSYMGKQTVEYMSPFDASREAGYKEIAAANRIEFERRKQERSDAQFQMIGALVNGAAQGYAEAKAQQAAAGSAIEVLPAPRAMPAPAVTAASSSGPVAGPSAGATGGQPLRFVLSIGLVPRAGDTVNPTCYSNVITRPGPPGWGQGGFLPAGAGAAARETVESLKATFIAACRSASGREVTSEGDFHWTWNELKAGEAQMAATHAQYHEDVTVNL